MIAPIASEPGPTSSGPAFERDLDRQLTPLRVALTQLLKELGFPPTPRVLQRQLGVGYSGCWRLFRFVGAGGVTADAQHAPSPAALKRVLASARTHGASDRTARAVEGAAEQLSRFIDRHAENRAAFDSMVAGGTTRRSAETLILQRRRTAYRALSHLWGVQTDLQCITGIVGPPSADGRNRVTLIQQRGIRRLRADTPVTLTGYRDDPGADLGRVPLDPAAAAAHGWPILPAFSSRPVPAVRAVDLPSGWRLYNMVDGDVGLRSNIDCTFGITSRQPCEVGPDGRPLHQLSFTSHRKPIALLVLDLIVHRGAYPGIVPESMIHPYTDGEESLSAARQSQRFPGEDVVLPAGPADALTLDEAPNYARLLRSAARVKGWDLADFDAHRLRVPYPIFSTVARVFFQTG